MKAFITKYALSSGVYEMEGDLHIPPLGARQYFEVVPAKLGGINWYFGKDFQLSKEDACSRVREMFNRREASLRISLADLSDKKAIALQQIKNSTTTTKILPP